MADTPLPRRGFFKQSLAELMKPLGHALRPARQIMDELNKLEGFVMDADPTPTGPVKHWLRPPGSVEEEQFRNQCSRSGECVRVCPVKCIKLDYSGTEGEGVPYIDPDDMSCVLCTGLQCMYACPSGALMSVNFEYIDMGIAEWHEPTCLRTQGQDCQLCVDVCPVGARAINVEGNRIEVTPGGCTGCGSCQHECPTAPKSITVHPKSNR